MGQFGSTRILSVRSATSKSSNLAAWNVDGWKNNRFFVSLQNFFLLLNMGGQSFWLCILKNYHILLPSSYAKLFCKPSMLVINTSLICSLIWHSKRPNKKLNCALHTCERLKWICINWSIVVLNKSILISVLIKLNKINKIVVKSQ